MAAVALGRVDPWDPRDDRKIYTVWLGLMWAGLIAGFGLDIPIYFLKQVPPPPFIIYVHAVFFTAWMFVLTAQVLLIQSKRIALHRKLGIAALGYAGLLLVLGPAAALTLQAQTLGMPSSDPAFLSVNIVNMLDFGLFTAAGYFLRRDPASHKRMMMLAMVAFADPGYSRITGALLPLPPHEFWPFLLLTYYGNFALVGLMAGWDLWRRGTLNRAFAIGAVAILASEAAAAALYASPAWKQVAVAIIQAWGYKG